MPPIKLTDNSSLEISASSVSPNYLQNGLEFLFRNLSPVFKHAQNKTIGDLDPESFPLTLSASVPGGSFAVSSATLSVKPGESASIDLLTGDKKDDCLKALQLPSSFAPGLISFALTTTLDSGPSGTVGDFSFGLTSGQEITVENYAPAAPTEGFVDATGAAISGLTLPHKVADLQSLPKGNICRLEGKGSLKFTASVQYSIFSNTLASAPLDLVSSSLSVKATSGAKFQVAVEHSDTHELTIAALGDNKVRLGVSLTKESSTEESLDFSIGVTANIGTEDGLGFLLGQISPSPAKELQGIRAALGPGEQSDVSSQIKKVLEGATKGGIAATLHEALKQSKERNHLFIYDIDLDALDAAADAALQSALKGDFTQITAGSSLAGVTEISSVSTLTLTSTNTLTIHLLGILNFSDVSSFVTKSKVALNSETNEVVLTATETKILQNTIDPDHLREVLTKCAMITVGAASSGKNPDLKFKMVFFLEKAQPSRSDLQKFANVLGAVFSPDAPGANRLLNGSPADARDVLIYLSLALSSESSLTVFRGRTSDDFVLAGQNALKTILAGDSDSGGRLALLSADLNFWKSLRDAGAGSNVERLLKDKGITDPAASVDFFSIDWWAQAMGAVAAALADNESLLSAEKQALKKSQGGFDEPWALLATYRLAGSPSVTTKLTTAPPPKIAARSTAASSS